MQLARGIWSSTQCRSGPDVSLETKLFPAPAAIRPIGLPS
ncbi:hypothetical protein RAM_34960 [Amycolatopsis mediterranei S699]|uniref:Uncharacterized protein n=1 Tax=Amycolatopsis mediterranei (strain S699) TaxID=713604 RepID=A0A9R0UC78_AMYMS|nr:hypothetical protein RAM_34960 [Amycolatopsis mediterranei S699]